MIKKVEVTFRPHKRGTIQWECKARFKNEKQVRFQDFLVYASIPSQDTTVVSCSYDVVRLVGQNKEKSISAAKKAADIFVTNFLWALEEFEKESEEIHKENYTIENYQTCE